VMTDSSTVLEGAFKSRKHSQVNHQASEYVRYEDGLCITTNAIEGYFATLKRGIKGVYHCASPKLHPTREITSLNG
jgi:hypothetical protein